MVYLNVRNLQNPKNIINKLSILWKNKIKIKELILLFYLINNY